LEEIRFFETSLIICRSTWRDAL